MKRREFPAHPEVLVSGSRVRAALVVPLVSAVLLDPSVAPGADCILYRDHLHAIDRDFPGGNAAAILGGYLVVAGDAALETLDVSDPANPERVGSVPLPTAGLDLALAGTVAYVAGSTGGVHIVDLADPGAPSFEGSLAAYDEATGVDVDGDHLAVANGLDGVAVLDIADPFAPVELGAYNTAGISKRVDLHWPMAHVADFLSYTMVDFTDPGNPDPRGVAGPVSQAWDVAVSGNRAAVAGLDFGVGLVDISDPDLPVTLDTEPFLAGAVDVQWYAGDLLFAGRRGLCAVSVVADELSWDGAADGRGDGNGLVVSAEVAYLISTLEVTTVDLSSRSSPKALGSEALPGFSATDVVVLRDNAHALYGCGTGGLQIVTKDRDAPVWIGGIAARSITRHLRLIPGTDVAVVVDDGIRTVDTASPRALDEVGYVDTPGGGRGRVFVESRRAQDLAYLADGTAGLVVVDVTDAENPAVIGGADTPGFALDVEVHDQVAYVADEFPGVQVFDVADPANPVYVQTIAVEDRAVAVASKGDYLLVSDGPRGVRIHDFATLALAAFVPIPEFVQDITVDGDVAYAPDQRSVHVLDLADPAAPQYLGATHPDGQPFAVAVGPDALWTADLTARTLTYPKQCPITTAVAFSAFTAQAGFWTVDLAWSTSIETNHDGFRIERGEPGGGTEWRAITDGLVRGRSPYHWTDADVDADRTYAYRLVAVEQGGAEQTGSPVMVTTPSWPRAAVSLEGVAPNPFRAETTLRFTLRRPERVRVTLHDVAGRRLRTLADGRLDAGAHRLAWDGTDEAGRRAAAGVYFVRFESPAGSRAMRITRAD